MQREHRVPRVVIAIAVAALAAIATLLLFLRGSPGESRADEEVRAAPAPAAREAVRQARRMPGGPAGQERGSTDQEIPDRQDPDSLDVMQPVAGQPDKVPSFSGKPMEPVLPALEEVRGQLTPQVARCVAESRGSEQSPGDPLQVRLVLFIERGQARVEFERVEPEGDREFPVLDACLASALSDKRFAVRAAPPADYTEAGIFRLPWVAKVSLGSQPGGGT